MATRRIRKAPNRKAVRRAKRASARRTKAKKPLNRIKGKSVRRTKAKKPLNGIKGKSVRRTKAKKRLSLTLDFLRREVAARGLGWVAAKQPTRRIRIGVRPRHRALRRASLRLMFTPAGSPPPIDWREKVSLSAPRNQGDRNTCTSFAICATIQDLRTIAGKQAPVLAPGFVHTCLGRKADTEGFNLRSALRKLQGNVLIPRGTASNYPWPAGQCAVAQGVAGLSSWTELSSDDEGMAALRRGPIVAAMKLYLDFRKFYGSGIYRRLPSPENKYEGEHSVSVVGFSNGGGGHWIIKNSFGVSWGDHGFARVAFGECGLLTGLQAFEITV